jgi:hypothetical protein
MRRIVLLAIICFVVFGWSSVSVPTPSAGAQGLLQALPTNTKRPPSLPTNTPRPPTATDAPPTVPPTITPTFTVTATFTPSPTETPTLTPTTIGPVQYPDNINSLTGLPFPDEAARNRRNLIVKVSNYPWIVRPQSGLSYADVVYEYEVEGGVTRFAAIYRSHGADYVGSIRSARLPDLELVVMYNALLAYSGANDNIKKMIGEAEWNYLALTPQWGDNCPPFCRFPQPGVPFEHTLFGSTFKMWDLATRRQINEGYPGRGFAFSDVPDQNGRVANDIFIKWFGDQDARWQYNAGDGKYHRWNTGIPHMDVATGQQLAFDNVVVIQAEHYERPDIYESESGSPAVEVQLWGQDKAWVFRDGRWYEGVWIRRNRTRFGTALTLMYRDGKTPIHLRPGQTWVEVVRCCNMFGVTVSEGYADVRATAAAAAATATLRGPRLATDPAQGTLQAESYVATRNSSAATIAVTTTPIYQGTPPSDLSAITPPPSATLPAAPNARQPTPSPQPAVVG